MNLALVTGTLFRAPEQRTSKAGKPFVTATLRAKDGELQWWSVIGFSQTAQVELMRLGDGDAVTVQGSFKAELYPPDGGEAKLSLSILADQFSRFVSRRNARRTPRSGAHGAPAMGRMTKSRSGGQ
jgi:single-stranded DNA-binding protein